MKVILLILQSSIIHFKKIHPTQKKKRLNIFIVCCRNAEPPDEETARGIIDKLFFSDKRYDLGEVGRYRINKKLDLETPMDVKILTKEDIFSLSNTLLS